MNESQNTELLDQPAPEDGSYIDVVCDSCSAGYQVSVLHFKDSYKHQFHCENCGEEWVEYLDIPVWEEMRAPIQALAQKEKEEQQAILQIQQEKEGAERAAREKEEAEQKAKEEEDFASIADTLEAPADKDAISLESDAVKVLDGLQHDDASEKSEEEPQEALDPIAAAIEQAAKEASESSDAAPDNANSTDEEHSTEEDEEKPKAEPESEPEKGVKKFLVYLSPKKWGDFSIVPLALALALMLIVIIGSSSYFLLLRESIVRQNPLAAAPYSSVGITVSPVDGFELNIERIERKDIIIPGEHTEYEYLLRAKVLNLSGVENRVPYARFTVLDIEGKSLSVWDVNLTSRVLQHEEEMHVVLKIPESLIGNERVDTFSLRLLSKVERELLGESPLLENQSST